MRAMNERTKELLGWYESARRDLPWRRSSDPWAIWVSEIMLQQTRVEAVREKWQSFVATYATPAAFARATDDELLAAWQGLGYYRRARLLRDGARQVVAEHGGEVPRDAAALAALPGVGDYTRGAIGSIAFGLELPAIDGNVERVLSRVLALDENPKRRAARDRMRSEIRDLQVGAAPGDVNQALMELGATVCLPKRPRCDACPWQAHCIARHDDRIDELPNVRAREKPIDVATEVVIARRDNALLVRRIPRGEINENQLCLPGLGVPTPHATALAPWLRDQYDLDLALTDTRAEFKHGITKWRITVRVREAIDPPARSRLRGSTRRLEYIPLGDDARPRAAQPTTTLLRKALDALDRAHQTR